MSVPFRKIVCEFGPVRSGPFRGIVDPLSARVTSLVVSYCSVITHAVWIISLYWL